jgi:multiple sugar transport system permease protein
MRLSRRVATTTGKGLSWPKLAPQLAAYGFLLPAILLFAAFAWYPSLLGFVIAFQKLDLINPPQWVGWDNFRQLLRDPTFARMWLNTLQYTGLSLLLSYPLSILLAVAISEMRHLGGFFRTMFYLPTMLPPIVTVLLWNWIYDPGPGLANTVLRFLHLPTSPWLQSGSTAMLSIVILTAWSSIGGTMIIYLAALQGIPGELYEAAEIDGASFWQRVFSITLPSIRFAMISLFILQVIWSMQIFTEPFVLTGGGPANATDTVMLVLYRYAFRYGDYGAAGALGLILLLVLASLSLLYFQFTRRYQ